MTIREIGQDDTSGRELFFQLPHDVYRKDPVWVPEQKERLNIFSDRETGIIRVPLLAMAGEEAVARLVCIFHPQASGDDGKPQGWISYFEGLEAYMGLARKLLQKAEEVLAGMGVASVVVPKADNQAMGFLVKGFHLPQTVMTTHNPPYYPALFKSAGYTVKTRAVSFYFRRKGFRPPVMAVPGIRTRELDRGNLGAEIHHFNRLQNAIFAQRDGYLARTPSEDEALVRAFLPFLDEELVIFAEDEAGQPVGILLCLPDSNQALKGGKITRVRIISIGVMPGWEGRGAGKAMGRHLMQNLLRKTEYEEAEASWIIKHNLPPQLLALKFGALRGREFALLEKILE
jgi:ribosomal protein S18 acetylase RimI-like enzyme